MKQLLFLLFLFPASSFAQAVQFCETATPTHILTLEQVGTNIQVILDDKKMNRYADLSNPKEGRLKLSGKERITIVIEGKKLSEFRKMRYLPSELLVAMMMGRPEYIGDEDLLHSYASNYISSLKCN